MSWITQELWSSSVKCLIVSQKKKKNFAASSTDGTTVAGSQKLEWITNTKCMSREMLAPINVEWHVESQVNMSPFFLYMIQMAVKLWDSLLGNNFLLFFFLKKKTLLLKTKDIEAGHSTQLQIAQKHFRLILLLWTVHHKKENKKDPWKFFLIFLYQLLQASVQEGNQ